MSRAEWWCDTLLKQATVPTLLASAPVGTCSINCCLHRACRLHTLSIARIKETTRWTLWNFYSMCSLLFPFFLSFFLFLFPTLAPLSLFSSATKQTRKTSPCHVFQLDFLPAQKRSSISLVLSQRTSPLDLPEAKTWLRKGGRGG